VSINQVNHPEIPALDWPSFPLVGEVQTVPRAELYAMFVVVKKVPYGTIMIVSDSKINVDMFYKSRMVALGFVCVLVAAWPLARARRLAGKQTTPKMQANSGIHQGSGWLNKTTH
jgi:hypothetical protein